MRHQLILFFENIQKHIDVCRGSQTVEDQDCHAEATPQGIRVLLERDEGYSNQDPTARDILRRSER